MTIEELNKLIKEELDAFLNEADDDIEVTTDEPAAETGEEALDTLKQIYDLIRPQVEDEVEEEPEMDDVPDDEEGEDAPEEEEGDEEEDENLDEVFNLSKNDTSQFTAGGPKGRVNLSKNDTKQFVPTGGKKGLQLSKDKLKKALSPAQLNVIANKIKDPGAADDILAGIEDILNAVGINNLDVDKDGDKTRDSGGATIANRLIKHNDKRAQNEEKLNESTDFAARFKKLANIKK